MRILIVHNAYQQYGGEDAVFAAEVELLRSAGHHVDTLHETNDSIDGFAARVSTALLTVRNPAGRRKMAAALERSRPDVVHVHNFFPRLSPAIFDACADAGVPAVWTLHNYRIACANGLLFRDGSPCEDCLGGSLLPAVLHRCYRGSAAGSAVVAAMIGYQRLTGAWRTKVARFVALSRFAAAKIEAAGAPRDRIVVKPNFVQDPALAPEARRPRKGAVFVGRLSAEKGVRTLIEAWRGIDAPLTVIGEGPELSALLALAPPNVRFVGRQGRDDVNAALAGAQMIVVPSVWYENCPMTVIEALALGTPVVASRIGALAELIEDGVNGFHFAVGDAADLARVVREALSDPARLAVAGKNARRIYEERYSPESNLEQLEAIYRDAVLHSASRGSIAPAA